MNVCLCCWISPPFGEGGNCGYILPCWRRWDEMWFHWLVWFFLNCPLVLINEVDKQLFRENNKLLTVSHSSARLTVQRDGGRAPWTCTERCRYGLVCVAEQHFVIPGSKIKVLISYDSISICAQAPQWARITSSKRSKNLFPPLSPSLSFHFFLLSSPTGTHSSRGDNWVDLLN